jgi:hypothetical protein
MNTKKTLANNFIRISVLAFTIAIFFISDLTFVKASSPGDLTVTQTTNLNGNNATVNVPFNFIFTVSNANDTSNFSNNTIIFSDALSNKANFGVPVISKSSGVLGDVECKINGIFKKSLDCKAKNAVSVPAGGIITITLRVTPTALGIFINPRPENKTHCKVDYTSSVNGDVFESNENNNDCTPQSLSITINGAVTSGNNLILNPSVEVVDPADTSLPENWISSSWGTNNTVFTYPISGHDSPKALRIDMSSYTDGDARWQFKEIPVNPLESYTFSDWYKSDVSTYPIVRFTDTSGNYYYFALRTASSSPDWKQFSESFSVPFTAKTMSVSHIIKSVGSLSLDDYSLVKLPELIP